MATVGGSFAVVGGTYREIEMDTEGMTPDQIADALFDQAEPVTLCHQCSGECGSPELDELAGFSVDGVEYELTETGWRRADEPRPELNPLRRLQESLAGFRAPELPAEVREAFEAICRRVNETMRVPRP